MPTLTPEGCDDMSILKDLTITDRRPSAGRDQHIHQMKAKPSRIAAMVTRWVGRMSRSST